MSTPRFTWMNYNNGCNILLERWLLSVVSTIHKYLKRMGLSVQKVSYFITILFESLFLSHRKTDDIWFLISMILVTQIWDCIHLGSVTTVSAHHAWPWQTFFKQLSIFAKQVDESRRAAFRRDMSYHNREQFLFVDESSKDDRTFVVCWQ